MLSKSFLIIVLALTSWNFCHCGKSENVKLKSDNRYRGVTAFGGLNLRDQPTPNASKLALIPENEYIQILQNGLKSEEIDGASGTWVKVRHEDKEGWVFDAFLTKREVSSDCIVSKKYPSNQYKKPDWQVNYGCGTETEDLLLNAAWFYRKWWRDSEGDALQRPDREKQRKIMKDIRKDVNVKKVQGRVALLSRTSTAMDFATFTSNEDIWILKDGAWQFFAGVYGYGESYIGDINRDNLPDIATAYGCCDNLTVRIFLGDQQTVLKQVHEESYHSDEMYLLKFEPCDKFALHGRIAKPYKQVKYKFNCAENKLIQHM